jgi:hypothetical protein
VIPLTTATSWLLLIALGALGVTFAVLLARHLEAVDDRRSMERWKATGDVCDRFNRLLDAAAFDPDPTFHGTPYGFSERPYDVELEPWEDTDD